MSVHHERVRAAFEGLTADRYPICQQAVASSVASELMGREMYTGSTELHFQEGLAWLDGDEAHEEFEEKLLEDCVALARHMDFDILFVPWRMQARPTKRIDENALLYGDPESDYWLIRRFDPKSRTYGVEKGPPPPSAEVVMDQMRARIEAASKEAPGARVDSFRLRAQRGYGNEFVVAGSAAMSVPMQAGWLEATALDPELVGEWLDVTVETQIASMKAQHEAGFWLFNGGGDFAFNSGPIYSPRFFDRIMAPRWKRTFEACRDLGGVYVMRSDGDLWPVAKTLFGDCRPEAYYECDYDAGMRFGELRQAFPELVLIGNVSCDVLLTGTAEQVRQHTLECLEAAAPRYIGSSSNSILHGTPPENVHAMFDAVKGFRRNETIILQGRQA